MAGISLDDLINSMTKAGIPMNTMSAQPTYKDRSDFMTASRSMIPQAIRGQAPNADNYKQDYMNKIAKIAEMDQKLAGVYGDPSSNLYIEHAGQRENAIYGARPAMEAASQQPIDRYNQDVNQFNIDEQTKLDMAKSYYDSLIEQQQNAEKQMKAAQGATIADYASLEEEINKALTGQDSTGDLESEIEKALLYG